MTDDRRVAKEVKRGRCLSLLSDKLQFVVLPARIDKLKFVGHKAPPKRDCGKKSKTISLFLELLLTDCALNHILSSLD